MVYYLLAYLVETGILGQVGDETVHFAEHFNVLYHFEAVGLQTAVEIVQVVDAAYLAGRGIEEFGGDGLRQRVVTLLLVPGDEVVAVFLNHAVQFWNLVRRVLQVSIHGDDYIALRLLKATV